MNLYRLKLRPASFRGVRFSVDSSEYTAGRRTVLHQYPNRDTPYVEDLGRAARDYTLTAFVVGPDYIERTQRLMQALETQGAGRLVHPWLGEITVAVSSVGTAQFDKSLGLATVSLSFVEAGELQNPAAGREWVSVLRSRIDSLLDTAAQEFSNLIDLDGVQDFVTQATDDAWAVARDVFANDTFLKALGVSNSILTIPAAALSLNPLGFAKTVISSTGLNAFVGVFSDWRGISSNLIKMSRNGAISPKEPQDFVVGSSEEKIANNQAVVFEFSRTVMIAQAAGAASMIGETAESNDAIPVTYDSLIELRNDLLDVIDSNVLETKSDAVAYELEGMRSAVYQTITERARENARLITINPAANTPLVVIAYDQYENPDRADEIAKINGVKNIGFSPFGGLKVLSV